MMRTWFFYTATTLLLAFTQTLWACTTIIVGKQAALEGHTIIARTSDTVDARRAKNFKQYHDDEQKVNYSGLPYWDLEPDETRDMAQVSTNKFRVSLSATETIQSNHTALAEDPPSGVVEGVSEPNIPNIVMPTATTARHAIDILGAAIESRGIGGRKGYGVLFADENEAWYLETLSGHQWVAIQVPPNVYFVASNGPGQIQTYSPNVYTFKMSHFEGKTPIEFAEEHKMAHYTATGQFNFRETYADIKNAENPQVNYVRIAYLQHYFNPNTQPFDMNTIHEGIFPMFLTPETKISVEDIQKVLGSHYEEFPNMDPYVQSTKDDVRLFFYPISNVRTSNAHITVVRENTDAALANIEYIALGMPSLSIYLPIYFGLTDIPQALTGATNRADDAREKMFWQFRALQALVFLSDTQKNIPFEANRRMKWVRQQYDTLAKSIEVQQLEMEKKYTEQKDAQLIDTFTENVLTQISYLNQYMINYFINTLDVENQYDLHDLHHYAGWFTSIIRKQDCDYRSDHCVPRLMANPINRFVDEPVL